jgi:hypothetical protein
MTNVIKLGSAPQSSRVHGRHIALLALAGCVLLLAGVIARSRLTEAATSPAPAGAVIVPHSLLAPAEIEALPRLEIEGQN